MLGWDWSVEEGEEKEAGRESNSASAMRLEFQTKLRSHINALAGLCATSIQEQLSFSGSRPRIYWHL